LLLEMEDEEEEDLELTEAASISTNVDAANISITTTQI